jgi:hypothetical protein
MFFMLIPFYMKIINKVGGTGRPGLNVGMTRYFTLTSMPVARCFG